jgi:hypothetical protein
MQLALVGERRCALRGGRLDAREQREREEETMELGFHVVFKFCPPWADGD